MRAFLTVSVGERPQNSRPLFVSDDPRLVGAVLRELMACIGATAVLEDMPDEPHTRDEHVERELSGP